MGRLKEQFKSLTRLNIKTSAAEKEPDSPTPALSPASRTSFLRSRSYASKPLTPDSDSSTLASISLPRYGPRGNPFKSPKSPTLKGFHSPPPTYLLASANWFQTFQDIASDSYIRPLITLGGRTAADQQLYTSLLLQTIPLNDSPSNVSNHCPVCASHDDSIQHWFYDCASTRQFLSFLRLEINSSLSRPLPIELITLRDLVYCFPDLRGFLGREEVETLVQLHSQALLAIFLNRKVHSQMSSSTGICESFLMLSMKRKLETDGMSSFMTETDNTDKRSSEFSNTTKDDAGSMPDEDNDIIEDIILMHFSSKSIDSMRYSCNSDSILFESKSVLETETIQVTGEKGEVMKEEEKKVEVIADSVLFEGTPKAFLRRRGKFFLDGSIVDGR